jgi:hypothetical protein
MSLSADPSITYNSEGNILATSTSIAASGTSSGNIVDYSASLGGWVTVTYTGGSSVAGTNGVTIDVFPATDSTPHYASTANPAFGPLAVTASTTLRYTFWLGMGKYSISLVNADATNAITAGITSNPGT